jgi:hypothetical protein
MSENNDKSSKEVTKEEKDESIKIQATMNEQI